MIREEIIKTTVEMADLYKQGWTLKQIGEKFGLTRQAIQQRLQKVGISRRNKGLEPKFDKIDKSNLQRLYSEGKNLNYIAEYFSVSEWTIYEAIKFHKIPK